MKYLLLFLLLPITPSCSLAQDGVAYPVTVHVFSSHRFGSYQSLEVDIDGTGYQLLGPIGKHGLLDLGDYQAKLVKDEHRSKEWKAAYEFILPDKKTRKFSVTGKTKLTAIFIPLETATKDSDADHVAQSQTQPPQTRKPN
jgi:hypothetical protein